jgi:hypothetical protein
VIAGLMALAVLAAVAVVALRLLQRRAVERARPGATAATAIAIHDYGEMDIAVRLQTCACGGHFCLRGEGPLSGADRPTRVAHLECQKCERERRLYFDLSSLRH